MHAYTHNVYQVTFRKFYCTILFFYKKPDASMHDVPKVTATLSSMYMITWLAFHTVND